MKKEPGSTRETRRWQDIRALAIDATFVADRRRVGERVAVVFRLVAVAHAVDPHPLTQGHSSLVVAIADAIGRRSATPSDHFEDLCTAAFLHDVGHMTLAADGASLEAPGHAEEGEKIVTGAKFPPDVMPLCAITISVGMRRPSRWPNR